MRATPPKPQPGPTEIENARSMLDEAEKYMHQTIAAHVRIDGLRVANELTPGVEILEAFNVAASTVLGAIECSKIELDGGDAGRAWRAIYGAAVDHAHLNAGAPEQSSVDARAIDDLRLMLSEAQKQIAMLAGLVVLGVDDTHFHFGEAHLRRVRKIAADLAANIEGAVGAVAKLAPVPAAPSLDAAAEE